MATPINQQTTINDQTFYTYPCRFEQDCTNYNPALTIPVTIKGIGGPKVLLKLNNCTHGGGCACSSFKRIASDKIFLEGGIR